MSAEREALEASLLDAFLARDDAALRDQARGEAAALGEDLRSLAAVLDDGSSASPVVVERAMRAARAELAASRRPGALARELGRMLFATALPLALVAAWNAAVLVLGPSLLEPWLPNPLPQVIPALYVFGSVGWLALVYGSFPALAHIELARRHREALA